MTGVTSDMLNFGGAKNCEEGEAWIHYDTLSDKSDKEQRATCRQRDLPSLSSWIVILLQVLLAVSSQSSSRAKVRYVHTKILLIDFFSDEPIAASPELAQTFSCSCFLFPDFVPR